MITRETRTLVITAVLAVGVPIGLAYWLRSRTDELAERLASAGGVPVTIGSIDADLGGSLRLSDVAFGELVTADAIEASVGMSSLLDGQLRADEIRVEGPHVSIRADADGDSDVARLARRLAGSRTGATTEPRPRLDAARPRIVVAGGTLTARIAGLGELTAEDVELVPDRDGVRIVTGPVRVRGGDRRLGIDLAFDRSAAELGLPHARFGRVLAVGGAGTITAGAEALVVRDLAAGRRTPGGTLEIRAAVDDSGVARRIAVDIALDRDASAHAPQLAITLRGERVPLRAFGSLVPRVLDLGETHATGSVTVRRSVRALQLVVDGTLEDLVIDHRTIAPEPLAVTAGVTGEVTVSPDAIAVTNAGLTLGSIQLAASGWVRRGAPISGQLDLQLASAPCAQLLASVPDSLRGPIDGMVLTGSLGGRARLALDLAAPAGDGATLTSSLAGGCRATTEPPAADVTKLAQASEQQLADGTQVRVGPGEPEWTSLRGLPSYLSDAFVSAEDGRFFAHAGFDLHQIARSLEIDLREHRLARGGSTISQQLIKNAFLTQRRSFDRKLQEAILTWRLEARLDKKQILERYLNIIELGPRIHGIGAAARYWFDVSPRELTVRQAAFLAALTSQPASMSRRIRRHGGLDDDSAERVAVVLRAMRRDGAIKGDAYEAAKAASLHFTSTAVPTER